MRTLIGFVAIACVVGMGCSSKDASDGAGGSAGAGGGTGGGTLTGRPLLDDPCSASGVPQTCPGGAIYGQCVKDRCDAQLKAAYGDGYATGSFTGPCASYAMCVQGCSCNAGFGACKVGCRNSAPSGCTSSLQTAEVCMQSSGCVKAVCVSGDAGVPNYSCDTLKSTCCYMLGEAKLKDSCYAFGNSGNEPACGAAYGALQLDSFCN
jgi:hypothetical protein